MDVQTILHRRRELLENHPGESTAWIESVIERGERDEAGFYRELNSKRMWGGAGSIANEALADNPGMNERIWRAEIRELRELMIELGRAHQRRQAMRFWYPHCLPMCSEPWHAEMANCFRTDL